MTRSSSPSLIRASLTALSLALLCLWPARAAAGELTYAAAEGCPARAVFEQRAAERAPNARDARVLIRHRPSSFVGDVSIGTGDDVVERRVEGRTCEAVLDALVLVLSLDHGASPAAGLVEPAPVETSAATVRAPRGAADPDVDAAPLAEPKDARSAVELAFGQQLQVRKLQRKLVVGPALVAEVGGPGLFGYGPYRPSARLDLVALSSYEGSGGPVHLGNGDALVSTTLLGLGLDVCPVGFAVVSTARLELTMSACALMNVGSGGAYEHALWTDAGGLGRVAMQLGRKGHVRGFVELSGGILGRLGSALPVSSVSTTRSANVTEAQATFASPLSSGPMWTAGIGGGVVLP